MSKQKRTLLIESLLPALRDDLITEQHTRPAGEHDAMPPHEVILGAVTRSVKKELNAITLEDGAFEEAAKRVIRKWNHYIAFVFDPNSSIESYHRNAEDIKAVADIAQSGSLKAQLDRQIIWRAQQLPTQRIHPDTQNLTDTSLQDIYCDLAIRHNTRFILGTIGNTLKKSNPDLLPSTNDFTPNIIQMMKDKMRAGYDPVRVNVSTYMSNPIRWTILRELTGLAQDRFYQSIKNGLIGTANSEDGVMHDPRAHDTRNAATSGLAFSGEHGGQEIIDRMIRAAEQLDSEKGKEIFASKVAHPDATLQKLSTEHQITRERVRQVLCDVGRQIRRIDPALATYCDAIINHDEAELDAESLKNTQGPSVRQEQVRQLLADVSHEMDALKASIGPQHIIERGNGELMISSTVTRGNKKQTKAAKDLIFTHETCKALEKIVASPFKDADFDVLSLRELQSLAFYPGGSTHLTAFVDAHLEDIADTVRTKHVAGTNNMPKLLAKSHALIEAYLHASDDDLKAYGKATLNGLLGSIEDHSGQALNGADLKLIRTLGMAHARRQHVSIA